MKKLVIILFVVLMNVFTVVATSTNTYKINYKNNVCLVNSKNNDWKNFNDSIMICDNMNIYTIYNFLQLQTDQYEEFYEIHENITKSFDYLSKKKEKGVNVFNNNIKINLRNSHYILDETQYHKYIRILNITLTNRGLSKYLLQ